MHALTNILLITANSDSPQGIAALGIDPLAILAQASTFLLLFWVIKKFALNKIAETLERRQETIESGVRLGREMEAARERFDAQIEEELKKARIQADKIIAQSHADAGSIMREAEESATRKVSTMIADAHAKIEDDIQLARRGLEAEIRNLIAEASAALLDEKLDAQKDMNLIERAIAKIRQA